MRDGLKDFQQRNGSDGTEEVWLQILRDDGKIARPQVFEYEDEDAKKIIFHRCLDLNAGAEAVAQLSEASFHLYVDLDADGKVRTYATEENALGGSQPLHLDQVLPLLNWS